MYSLTWVRIAYIPAGKRFHFIFSPHFTTNTYHTTIIIVLIIKKFKVSIFPCIIIIFWKAACGIPIDNKRDHHIIICSSLENKIQAKESNLTRRKLKYVYMIILPHNIIKVKWTFFRQNSFFYPSLQRGSAALSLLSALCLFPWSFGPDKNPQ